MARHDKDGRSQAEERFDRARKTNDEAMAIIRQSGGQITVYS